MIELALEELPPSLRKKLLEKAMKMIIDKSRAKQEYVPPSPREMVLNVLADERARELLERAEREYPEATRYAISVIARLIQAGYVRELDAETLLILLNNLGVPIRPEIRIKFVKKGKEVSLKEYLED